MLRYPTASMSSSRRLRQRANAANAATAQTNRTIRALNTLGASFRLTDLVQEKQETGNLRRLHEQSSVRATAYVYDCVTRYQRRSSAPDVGQGAGGTAALAAILKGGAPDTYSTMTDAFPLDADRVALPDRPGGVQLLDWLPDGLKQLYEAPMQPSAAQGSGWGASACRFAHQVPR